MGKRGQFSGNGVVVFKLPFDPHNKYMGWAYINSVILAESEENAGMNI